MTHFKCLAGTMAMMLGLAFGSISVGVAHAQDASEREIPTWLSDREMTAISFAYSLSVPVGDMNDMLGSIGYRGFDFSVLFPIASSLYLGGSFSSAGFYNETDRETYTEDRTAITGKLYRYANLWSFSGVARYMFMKPGDTLRPYLGLRVGVAVFDTTTYVADLGTSDTPVGLLLIPEGGLSVRLSRGLSGYVAYQFNFTTASTGRFDMLSYNAFNFGFTFQSF